MGFESFNQASQEQPKEAQVENYKDVTQENGEYFKDGVKLVEQDGELYVNEGTEAEPSLTRLLKEDESIISSS
jgi:hypothetical protein